MSPSRTSADLSAPSAHVPGSGLLDLLKSVPDPRGRRGRQHHLSAVLAVGLAAVIAGAKSFVAIGEWVAHQPIEALRDLGITTPTGPNESTLRRVFALLDADVLDQLVGAFMWTRPHSVEQRATCTCDFVSHHNGRAEQRRPGKSHYSETPDEPRSSRRLLQPFVGAGLAGASRTILCPDSI